MNKFIFPAILILLNSCGSLGEAGKILRNEKIKTTDEFLVKKKEPLILPSDYNNIPSPDSLSKKKIDEKDKIKNILKKGEKKSIGKNKSISVESSIIDRIK